jgi:hypothetical protein
MRSLRELARFATRVNSFAAPRTAAPTATFAQSRVIHMSTPAAVEVDAYKVGDSTNIQWHEGSVDSATREKAMVGLARFVKHHQLKTASMLHVTDLTPPGVNNPSGVW